MLLFILNQSSSIPFKSFNSHLGIFSVNYECSTIPQVEGNFSLAECNSRERDTL